jgi:adenylate cyclase
MERAAGWLYRRLGQHYLSAYLVFELVSALTIALATVGLLSLYEETSKAEFHRIVAFSWIGVVISLAVGAANLRKHIDPLVEWMRGRRGDRLAVDAWRTAVALPREFITRATWLPIVVVVFPVSGFITLELDLPFYSFAILVAGTLVALAYSVLLHFFASEQALRPVVREIAEYLPADFAEYQTGVPLRWKLLGALPLINVVTGVVVSGLSTDGRARLEDLGVDVVVAVIVAFTVSLELTILVTKSVLGPVRDLLAATERVKAGDLSARAPVSSGDEMGSLASSFNEMMAGLEERERLHEAFGSYVDPDVTERVLEEGTMLEGEDVEVTVFFVDIYDFTGFAERSSAQETVSLLNEFFGLVVPLVTKHRGHANKFIGDGMLAVFGAPERMPDHADRAVAAACEIANAVDEHWGDELQIGIGISSGPVSAGTIGGGGRLEFAVVGDTVNVAARVEQTTRELGDRILLTEATRTLLQREHDLEQRGEIELRGRSDPVALYSPVERAVAAVERGAAEPTVG